MLTLNEIKSMLNLKLHPTEGGYYAETYRSNEEVPVDSLPSRYTGSRSFSTAIYYLLTAETFSTMHRLRTDEMFHHYLGDPVEMLQLFPDGSGRTVIIGSDLLEGMRPQALVPGGVWQGARLIMGGRFALMGTTVSPGFDFKDYEAGKREVLLDSYPQFHELIYALTK